MDVALLIPPAIDWNMPLIKAYLPENWNVKVIGINAKLFFRNLTVMILTL